MVAWTIRRTAALAAVLLGLGLIAAPAALANGDTITTAATVQFSGVVDNGPSCAGSTAVIDWGDGSAPSQGSFDSNGNVDGTHTYSSQGTYNGTVTLTGGSCDVAAHDTFTADVKPAPQFKQCPPVDQDFGCQYLIVVSTSGTTILNDPNQGPYEGSEDALIGVVNNGSGSITSMPLSAPGLFSFDEDGLCTPGAAPVPSGCAPQPGAPSGDTCTSQDGSCSFPVPPGEPAGYTEPGAASGFRQNGYEGPSSWFSNVSTDTNSGVVNFSPALQSGQSTYFSLEEPPTTGSLNAGSAPSGLSSAPPTVSATSANFSAVVNPNGSPTKVAFQYGVNGKFGPAITAFSQSTPVQNIGGDFSDHDVSAHVTGLDPDAPYEVRVVASNKDGITLGTPVFFRTSKAAPPTSPTLGQTVNVAVASGVVLIKLHGVFVPLTQALQIPTNTVIDALGGTIKIASSTGGVPPASDARARKPKKPKTSTGTFGGAVFKVTQVRSGPNKSQTTLTLVEGAFKGAPTYASCTAKGAADTAHAALSRRALQSLRSRGSGRYSSRGRYAAGTVRGTVWTTTDRCDGTLIAVQQHSVLVTNLVTHKTILVTAGHHYLATAPKRKKH